MKKSLLQKKIEIKILQTIPTFEGLAIPDLIALVTRIPLATVQKTLDYLEESQIVYVSAGGCYHVTLLGEVYHAELSRTLYYSAQSYRQWVDEALTGITSDGKESHISRAAIPSSDTRSIVDPDQLSNPYETEDTTIRQMEARKILRQIKKESHLSWDAIYTLLDQGLIVKCNRCKTYQIGWRYKSGNLSKICIKCKAVKEWLKEDIEDHE